jgi:hypothetical protein
MGTAPGDTLFLGVHQPVPLETDEVLASGHGSNGKSPGCLLNGDGAGALQ